MMTRDVATKLREHRERRSVRQDDYRGEFERDYARILLSPSFRRLQGKSQIFGAGSGDFFRTRLTHSLEVAQFSGPLARKLAYRVREESHPGLMIDPKVVESAALAHDIGHPPFGHTGEHLLDDCLAEQGYRFEGNAQDFRQLRFLEKRWEPDESSPPAGAHINGLNLTDAVLLATNKYPNSLENEPFDTSNPVKRIKKGVYPADWQYIEDTRHTWRMPTGYRTLEAQLMDLCDDIVYSTHDLEDGVKVGKLNFELLSNEHHPMYESVLHTVVDGVISEQQQHASTAWPDADNVKDIVAAEFCALAARWRELVDTIGDFSRARRELKSQIIHEMGSHVGIIDDGPWKRITFVLAEDGSREDVALILRMMILKWVSWQMLVKDTRVQRLQKRGNFIIRRLWQSFYGEGNVERSTLPLDWRTRYEAENSKQPGSWPWPRFVADYIAGMTDAYAEHVFGELYANGRQGSIYDPE